MVGFGPRLTVHSVYHYIMFIEVVRSIQGYCVWLNIVIGQLTRNNRKKHDSL